MGMAKRSFRPVTLEIDGETFVIRFGRPGKPCIYRRIGNTERRLKDGDPTIQKVAHAFRVGVDRQRDMEARESIRKLTVRYRVGVWIGRQLTKLRTLLYRGVAAILDIGRGGSW